MKFKIIILTLALVTIFSAYKRSTIDKSQMVNPIIGDISFESKFGHKPDATTDETLRIKTHLEYVENVLRQKDISQLSFELQIKRERSLDILHAYWTKGIFPKNVDYTDQRKPCFIDKFGAICAVGYLVEKTAGRGVANEINERNKYAELLAMNDEAVNKWVLTSGLTLEECAMIQPTYGPPPVLTDNKIESSYGILTAGLGGLNLSLNTINGIQIGKGASNNTVPIIGLISGVGQIALGAAKFPKERQGVYGTIAMNESHKTLSMVNIGLGTTTMILSAWNLITNRKQKEKRTSWNIYGFPTPNNTAIAFSVTRKL